MPASEKIIEVKSLVKNYGKFRAVDKVSFDVYQGDVFGFLGPNGAGKSTTIRTMLTLINATSGEINIFGKELRSHRNEILAEIGCIVEIPDFYKYLSAEKNLEIFARISGKKISKSRLYEVLEFVGLKGREKDKVLGYSHGMKQRLGIAQTLIHDPKLIILDEPTTGLDPQGIIDIRNLILLLKNEKNKTVLLSSHILSEIELIANRMVIINKGKTLIQGNVRELLDEEDLVVTFTVDDIGKSIEMIRIAFPNSNVTSVSNQLLLHISKNEIPLYNQLLVEKGIQVFSIESRRKLEDYFLKLINN